MADEPAAEVCSFVCGVEFHGGHERRTHAARRRARVMTLDRSVDVAWLDAWASPLSALVILGGSAWWRSWWSSRSAASVPPIRASNEDSRACRLTGREVAGRLLERIGLTFVAVDDGAPLDHYDHLRRRVKLRTESSVSSSVAALAIAAHEVGHAEQFATGYWAARATRGLVVLLVFGEAVLLVYPFASTIAGASAVNLTWGTSLIALFALVRAPWRSHSRPTRPGGPIGCWPKQDWRTRPNSKESPACCGLLFSRTWHSMWRSWR